MIRTRRSKKPGFERLGLGSIVSPTHSDYNHVESANSCQQRQMGERAAPFGAKARLYTHRLAALKCRQIK
ncbi:MAG TPA: hypothetical protein VKA18_03515 [Alphaproteobacteria bacterium]|nr:hypothetical protein [Alphaproteobacteria bacterium]